MILDALQKAITNLVHRPVLWIPGIYAGIIGFSVIWLELTGEEFAAGKIVILSLIAFPFFLGILNHLLQGVESSPKELVSAGLKNYFPVLLPSIILGGIIILMVFIISIPFSLMGYGDEPTIIGGFLIGISIPALFFSIYTDNVAVCEKTRIIPTLQKSLETVGKNFFGTVAYVLTGGIAFIILSFLGSFIWVLGLADRFAPYLEMNITTQQETFSHFTLDDWLSLIGTEGAVITAAVFGFILFFLVPFLFVFKYYCYKGISEQIPEVQKIQGEYDEKGRWYKY
ncbi:MAG: hypothetical protein LUQ07_03220 [Methanospirillum sp.]|nr:hypothetical protein [Methanospirillum sp.]